MLSPKENPPKKNEPEISRTTTNAIQHKPVANLSAMLSTWLNDPQNHSRLADLINEALEIHKKESSLTKVKESVEDTAPIVYQTIEYFYPDRVKEIRTKYTMTDRQQKKVSSIQTENALAVFDEILSDPKGKWVEGGPYFFSSAASLNTKLVCLLVAEFRKDTDIIAESDGPNNSRYHRKNLTLFHTDLEKGRLNIQKDAKQIFEGCNTATYRSEMSHYHFAKTQSS